MLSLLLMMVVVVAVVVVKKKMMMVLLMKSAMVGSKSLFQARSRGRQQGGSRPRESELELATGPAAPLRGRKTVLYFK